jgi:hypothetical protein
LTETLVTDITVDLKGATKNLLISFVLDINLDQFMARELVPAPPEMGNRTVGTAHVLSMFNKNKARSWQR